MREYYNTHNTHIYIYDTQFCFCVTFNACDDDDDFHMEISYSITRELSLYRSQCVAK